MRETKYIFRSIQITILCIMDTLKYNEKRFLSKYYRIVFRIYKFEEIFGKKNMTIKPSVIHPILIKGVKE